MQKISIPLLFIMPMQTQITFNFDIQSDSSNWRLVDDVVMEMYQLSFYA